MMFRSLIIILLYCLFPYGLKAQELEVESVCLVKDDSTARINPRYDLNGDMTAVIKVYYKGNEELTFRGNVVDSHVNKKDCRLIYVADGTRRIYVYRDGSIPIEIDFTKYYDSQNGVTGGKTFAVKLRNMMVCKKKEDGRGARLLVFQSIHNIDSIIVDGKKWSIKNNTASRLIQFGEYSYKAYSGSFPPLNGTVEVNRSIGSMIVKLKFEE